MCTDWNSTMSGSFGRCKDQEERTKIIFMADNGKDEDDHDVEWDKQTQISGEASACEPTCGALVESWQSKHLHSKRQAKIVDFWHSNRLVTNITSACGALVESWHSEHWHSKYSTAQQQVLTQQAGIVDFWHSSRRRSSSVSFSCQPIEHSRDQST